MMKVKDGRRECNECGAKMIYIKNKSGEYWYCGCGNEEVE